MVAVVRLCGVRRLRRRSHLLSRNHWNVGIHHWPAANAMEGGVRIRNRCVIGRCGSCCTHGAGYQNAGARHKGEKAPRRSRRFHLWILLQRCYPDNIRRAVAPADNNRRGNGTSVVWCAPFARVRDWTRHSISYAGNCSKRFRKNAWQGREVSSSRRNSERDRSPRIVGLLRAVCPGFEMNLIRGGQVQRTLRATAFDSGQASSVPKTVDGRYDRGWSCTRRVIRNDCTARLGTHRYRLHASTPQQHGTDNLLAARAIHSLYIDFNSRGRPR